MKQSKLPGIYIFIVITKCNYKVISRCKYLYNRLNKSGIINQEYDHTKTIWNKFKIQNYLKAYTRLCNATNVLMLSGIFENCRDERLETYINQMYLGILQHLDCLGIRF